MKKNLAFATTILFIAGCGGNTQSADPKEAVAGDKTMIVETLKLADTKGTVGEALAEAAKDSSLHEKMEEALGIKKAHADARSSVKPTPGAQNKDVLDKSSDALDQANQKVTKTGQVLDKAGEVKQKAEDILNRH